PHSPACREKTAFLVGARTQSIYIFDVNVSSGDTSDRTEDLQCWAESGPGQIRVYRLRKRTYARQERAGSQEVPGLLLCRIPVFPDDPYPAGCQVPGRCQEPAETR